MVGLYLMEPSITEVFTEQKHLIDFFFANLNHSEIEEFANQVSNCRGMIFFTGMGKSGIISKNISQMLVSIGVKAMFLDPVNALHGDVGVISGDDLVVLFSRSGQTGELLNLMPAIRNKGARTIAIVSNKDGRLVKACDQSVYLPLERELCPFDLAPTTSSIIQLIFGNTVVACLMKNSGLTKEAYAVNHPAGRIGKRLTVTVEDVMKPVSDLAICLPTDKLIEQVSHMSAKRCGALLIEDSDGCLIGIFTDGDLRRAVQAHGSSALEKSLGDLMTSHPSTTHKSLMAFEAMQEMERVDCDKSKKKRVKELPVVNGDNKLEGLLLLHDLVQFGL